MMFNELMVHCAYNVTALLGIVNVALAAYCVPEPFAAVFQDEKV
jgi:hypothetical protein